MKITALSAGAVALAAIMSSCATTRTGNVADLSGEWNVETIDSKAVATPTDDDSAPFLAFDVVNSKVYGHAGCNNLSGELITGEGNTIDFTQLASTRRMCPDMATEQAMFDALGKTTSFTINKKGTLELLDNNDNKVITLAKRQDQISPATLEGPWKITYVGDLDLSTDTLDQYTALFTPADSTAVFTTGCNDISGKYSGKYIDIKFDALRSTRMACPDMAVEQELTQLLPSVASFSPLAAENTIGLYDANGNLLVILARE